jgi:hypothetical protein
VNRYLVGKDILREYCTSPALRLDYNVLDQRFSKSATAFSFFCLFTLRDSSTICQSLFGFLFFFLGQLSAERVVTVQVINFGLTDKTRKKLGALAICVKRLKPCEISSVSLSLSQLHFDQFFLLFLFPFFARMLKGQHTYSQNTR